MNLLAKKTNLVPMGNVVVVKHIQTVSIKGVAMPANMQDKLPRGEVLAVGPGHTTLTGTLVPIPLAAGDVVRFRSWVNTDHYGEIVLVDASDILCVEHP